MLVYSSSPKIIIILFAGSYRTVASGESNPGYRASVRFVQFQNDTLFCLVEYVTFHVLCDGTSKVKCFFLCCETISTDIVVPIVTLLDDEISLCHGKSLLRSGMLVHTDTPD